VGFAAAGFVAVGSAGVGDAGAVGDGDGTVGGGVNVAVAVRVSTGGATSVGVAGRRVRVGASGAADVAWSSDVVSAPLVAAGGAPGVAVSAVGEGVGVVSGGASIGVAGVVDGNGVVVAAAAASVVDDADNVCADGATAGARINLALPPPLTTVLATSTRQRPAGKPAVLNEAVAAPLPEAVTPNVVMV